MAVPPPPSTARRLIGGPPLVVLLRLLFASLVVGALLVWLDVDPMDVMRGVLRAAAQLWAMGFEAFGEAGRYLVAGAVIVVPGWLLIRLLSFRGAR